MSQNHRSSRLATLLATVGGNLFIVLGSVVFGSLAVLGSWLTPDGRWVFWMARLWSRGLLLASGLRLRVEGAAAARGAGALVFMPNHQSLYDIPALIASTPVPVFFLAKQSLFRIPVLGWAMRALGHMPIDRINRRTASKMLLESTERVARQRSVLVFPEETYSREQGLLPFQRGGFILALKTGLPILPVGVAGTREALPPGHRVITPTPLTVRFGEPIPTAGLAVSSRQSLADRTRQAIADLAGVPTS